MLEYGRVSGRYKRHSSLSMTFLPRRTALRAAAVSSVLLAGVSAAPALDAWMTEEAMRAAFIGKTLDGHYGNGVTWTETYFDTGRLDYRESRRRAVGNWYFRGHVFCTFYDPPLVQPPLNGGCWTTIKTSANCYEFYLAGLSPEPPFADDTPGMAQRWNARGWRKDEPSTCTEKPSV
jgi:hypothetical protein